jgi:hypothetical protein
MLARTVVVLVTLLLLPSLASAQSSRAEERLLIQADAFTPGPANAPPPPHPFSVSLADNITRLNLNVDQLLPLHGRIVPLAELSRAVGR